jgi:hypothetical protein
LTGGVARLFRIRGIPVRILSTKGVLHALTVATAGAPVAGARS